MNFWLKNIKPMSLLLFNEYVSLPSGERPWPIMEPPPRVFCETHFLTSPMSKQWKWFVGQDRKYLPKNCY